MIQIKEIINNKYFKHVKNGLLLAIYIDIICELWYELILYIAKNPTFIVYRDYNNFHTFVIITSLIGFYYMCDNSFNVLVEGLKYIRENRDKNE